MTVRSFGVFRLSLVVRRASHSPACVVNGSPVVAVQLLDGEAAVQEFREQLRVSFTGAAVEREVVHPLTLPAESLYRFL